MWRCAPPLLALVLLTGCAAASNELPESTTTTSVDAPQQVVPEQTTETAQESGPEAPPGPTYEDWEYGPIVLDSDDMDFLPVDPEAVTLPDGRIRLFVDGVQIGKIRSFTSENGIDFVADDVPALDGTFPNVVQLPDGRYRMYATRFFRADGPPGSGESKIISFVSDDALNWREEKGFRTTGTESSAVILKDGRTLMAIRRPSSSTRKLECVQEPSSIWFAISDNGRKFTDVSQIVDGATDTDLEGRAYGVELSRLANGEVVMHFEGCLPAFFAPVDEQTLELKPRVKSPLRGRGVYGHYGFTENIGGAGGDITLFVKDGEDWAYIALRDGPNAETSMDPSAKPPGVRQRLALATSAPAN